jgi:hypothetical protein
MSEEYTKTTISILELTVKRIVLFDHLKNAQTDFKSYFEKIFKKVKKTKSHHDHLLLLLFFKAINESKRLEIDERDKITSFAQETINALDVFSNEIVLKVAVELFEFLARPVVGENQEERGQTNTLLMENFLKYTEIESMKLETIAIIITKTKTAIPHEQLLSWFEILWRGHESIDLSQVIQKYAQNCDFEEYSVIFDLHLLKIESSPCLGSIKSLLFLLEASVNCNGFQKSKLSKRINVLLEDLYQLSMSTLNQDLIQVSLQIGQMIAKNQVLSIN